ncbi:4Fe-4S dicluster domain-containing protein [Candidatus Margulisiibacteriota bacterium]
MDGSRLIAPVESFGQAHLEEIDFTKISGIKLSGFRTVEPFKSYFFKLIEQVSQDPQGQKLIIMGARGCDVEAVEILDKVFGEGEFEDPFYLANRANVLIISADCSDCGLTCFCLTVKGQPYPNKLFDINFSLIDNGYVVEVGSEKGQKLITGNKSLLTDVSQAQAQAKASNRSRVNKLLTEVNKEFQSKLDLAETHKRNLENKAWKSLTKDCVECSACNFACPTCSCFLLVDQESSRFKVWDGCLKAGYTRVAGGANDRGQLYQRLQNRYHCKFDYSYDRLGRYTCVGCGRCIDGCAGKIDMRKIFVELEKQVPLTAKLA